jgi:hypothetical protein
MMQIAKQTSGPSTSELIQWMGIQDWLVRLESMEFGLISMDDGVGWIMDYGIQ